MFALEFLNARHGDCFFVHWGDPRRTMLIDGGPDGVYESTLRLRIMALSSDSAKRIPRLDTVCISHVDDDHIVGVLRLLAELDRARGGEPPFRIARLWHNSVEALLDNSTPGLTASAASLFQDARRESVVAASYRQGSEVRRLASSLGLAGNVPFRGPILSGAKTTQDGLTVVAATPSRQAVEELVEKWKEALEAQDAAAVAAAYRDRSVPNLSSITLFLHHGGSTALLTGDARGDHILTGLETAKIVGPGSVLSVDLLKLPHHGSSNNAAPSLFERVRAKHYVVSADGVRHHHPSEATLEWLVESRGRSAEYVIHFTNPIPFALAKLKALQPGRRFKIDVRQPEAPSIEIALGA